ncbi:MAG: 7-cyano-7-deazaguanine synthase [Actinobacteria bacterium ADurb.Bin444]|nr:MAG: 7-cyano-7-deazaguanine synthase [Actinobacteria bacterium ADurb.Bin444]
MIDTPKETPESTDAVVVLSGGQDSTTCLYHARRRHPHIHAITFAYGQRHQSELSASRLIARMAGVATHRVVDLSPYGALVASALTDPKLPVAPEGGMGNLPSTFTPGRNLVFLTIAASWAVSMGAWEVYTGVCQTDYSGYPDCRLETIAALEVAINLGLPEGHGICFDTPLMHMTKAEMVKLAASLDGCMEALAESVTCYHGKVPGCGACPACVLRAKGFAEAGIADPAQPQHVLR